MRNTLISFIITFCVFTSSFAQEKLTRFVNPFIGTGGTGHTFPGAVVPFGMVQLSPDNGKAGLSSSGYHYSDNTIAGFSHMHLSGTDLGDWLDISVMPLIFPLKGQDTIFRPSTFSHNNEQASPGYYAVKLDNGIQVELSVTERVGFHRYTFPTNTVPTIRFDLSFQQSGDKPTQTYIKRVDDSTLVGYRYSTGRAPSQRVYFAAKTSKPFSELRLKGELEIEVGGPNVGLESTEEGTGVKSQLIFAPIDNSETIQLKVALSMTSMDKAMEALKEIPHWNFDTVKAQADARWEKELSKVQISTNDSRLKRIFYTALYHTAIAPTLYSDSDGEYKNAQGEKQKLKSDDNRYTVFSLGDTFGALNPLFTLTQPERYTDMLNSIVAFYDEMGHSAIPILSDAILKDWPGLDKEKAYEAMKKSAVQKSKGVPDYIQYGYVPQDKSGQSASMTLEYAYNDWCIAAVAKKLGKLDDYKVFSSRALSYRNIFDRKTGFMRAKNSDGSWALPFDPYYYSDRDPAKAHYKEGNAWQHSFFVPHDIRGLQSLYGNDRLETKLDSLFSEDSKISGVNASLDTGGFIGQYAHGNKSSHYIAYMYNYLGKPWKTQTLVRQIVESMYHDRPDGYAGNENAGQMSAWAIWSMVGFYPVNPASGEYVIGSPMVDAATFQLTGNRTLRIQVLNNSSNNKYVQSVKLNGTTYKKSYFSHKNIIEGGEIVINMGPEPAVNWGSNESWFPSSQSCMTKAGTEVDKKDIFQRVSDFFNNIFK